MSAIVILQQTDAVHFITDGATYDEEGVVVALQSKVTHLPLSGCVFAMRGPTWPLNPLAFSLGLCTSFDEVTNLLPTVMMGLVGKWAALGGSALYQRKHFEVTIAGWSDRLQRMVAAVSKTCQPNDPDDPTALTRTAGYEPGVPVYPGQGYALPEIDIQTVLRRPLVSQADIDALDPERDGFALHSAQRRAPGIYCNRAAYIVGGFAELTTVRRDRVESRIIHEWPDSIGRQIVPDDAAPIEIAQTALEAIRALEAAQKAALCKSEPVLSALDQAA
jgi:hypothetical protein